MIECKLTKEQLLEALAALDIAHKNGWVNSKAIFKLKEYNNDFYNHKEIWEVAKDSSGGDIQLIVDGGSENGELNYGMCSYLYKDETPDSVKIKNEAIMAERESDDKFPNQEYDE